MLQRTPRKAIERDDRVDDDQQVAEHVRREEPNVLGDALVGLSTVSELRSR
jgi:hypothetical protein